MNFFFASCVPFVAFASFYHIGSKFLLKYLNRNSNIIGDSSLALERFKINNNNNNNENKLLPNGWFVVCQSGELKSGAVLKRSVRIHGKDICVWRNTDGKIVAHSAFCPHLGANLAVNGFVDIESNCLVCPFHAWKFDSNGDCEDTKAKIEVVYTTIELVGLVFIWISSSSSSSNYNFEQQTPKWLLSNVKELTSTTATLGYCHGDTEHRLACLAQDIPENGADMAHFGVIHKQSLFFPSILSHFWQTDWKVDEDNWFQSRIKYITGWCVFGYKLSFGKVTTEITQIGPGVTKIDFTLRGSPFITMFEAVTPVDPFVTKVNHYIFSDYYLLDMMAKFFLFTAVCQFELDVPIWVNKRYLSNPHLNTKDDGKIQQFRRWFGKFYE